MSLVMTSWFAQAQENVTLQSQLLNTNGEAIVLSYSVAAAGAVFTELDTTDANGFASTTLNIPAGGFFGGEVTLSFLDCDTVEITATAFLAPNDSVGGGLYASFVADYCGENNGGGGGDPVGNGDCELDLLWSSADGMWFEFTASETPPNVNLTWSVDGAMIDITQDTLLSLGFDFTPAWTVCVSYTSDSCGTVMDCVSSDEAWGGGGNDSLCTTTFEVVQAVDDAGNPIPSTVDVWMPEIDNVAYYFWDFGDEGTSEEPTPSHTYAGNGPYLLCLTVVYPETPLFPGCTAVHCDTVSVDDQGLLNGVLQGFTINVQVGTPATVGMAEWVDDVPFALYPNPVAQGSPLMWASDIQKWTPKTATIWDAQGRAVCLDVGVSSGFLSTAGLKPGTYFVRFTNGIGETRNTRFQVH